MSDQDSGHARDTSGSNPRLRHDPPDIPGYRLEVREAIPISRLNWIAIPLAIPFAVLFYLLGALIQGSYAIGLDASFVTLVVLLAIVLFIVPVLHEVVHGVAALLVGARPFFGVGEGFAYTSFHEPVDPFRYAAITAAPLVVLSGLSLAAFELRPDWFLYVLVFATTNGAGAVGDLWILTKIRKLPSNALIYDLADGYAAFVPEP